MTTREKLDQMKASEKKNADAEAKYRGASWKQRQIHALNYWYGLRAAHWQAEGHADARDEFVRRFDAMIRGVKSLPANPERYVRAAMEEKLARDRMELDKIIRGFERRDQA